MEKHLQVGFTGGGPSVCQRWTVIFPPLRDATVDSVPPLGDILQGWVVILVNLKPLCKDSRDVLGLGIVLCKEDIAINLLVTNDSCFWRRLRWCGTIPQKTSRVSLNDDCRLVSCENPSGYLVRPYACARHKQPPDHLPAHPVHCGGISPSLLLRLLGGGI